MLALVAGIGLVALVKTVLLTALAVLNGILAILATISVWKTYLVVGTKVALTLLVCIPIVGIVIWVMWGQYKVRDAR